MAETYCVLCRSKHEDFNWRHASWIEGEKDGWACSKWFTPSPSFKNYAHKGREADMQQLQLSLRTATNDAERMAVKKAMYKIQHEDKHKRAMREDLIRASRDADHKKIKEIHEDVHSSRKLRND